MRRPTALLLILPALIFFCTQPASAGPSKSGRAIASAKVDTGGAFLVSFGGSKTKSASVSGGGGDVLISFVGKYPKGIQLDDVIVLATARSGLYHVANAYVQSVTPNEIVVGVSTWVSNALAPAPGQAFVAVYLGE